MSHDGGLFTASESVLEVYLKDSDKRAKLKVYFSILQRVQYILEVYLKDTNKRANKQPQGEQNLFGWAMAGGCLSPYSLTRIAMNVP